MLAIPNLAAREWSAASDPGGKIPKEVAVMNLEATPPAPEPRQCKECGIIFGAESTPHWCGHCLGWLCEGCSAVHDDHRLPSDIG